MLPRHRLHLSLVRPVLLLGAERPLVILEATLLASLLSIGIRALTLLLAAAIVLVVHPLLVRAAKADPQAFRIYARSLHYQDFYPARAHPDAPPARQRTFMGS
jgi:type IV secretory pathway TrbD component